MNEAVDISGVDSYQARRILEDVLRKRGEYGFEPQKCDHCGHNAHCADAAPAVALDGIAQLQKYGHTVIAVGKDGRAYVMEETGGPVPGKSYYIWEPLPPLPIWKGK